MRVNKPYTNKEYADLAVYCNKNNCHIEDKGYYLESVENLPHIPTDEEQCQNRAQAYQQEVDPITAHIQRLRDEQQTEEILLKIEELIEERAIKVQEIKERFPYSNDPSEESYSE